MNQHRLSILFLKNAGLRSLLLLQQEEYNAGFSITDPHVPAAPIRLMAGLPGFEELAREHLSPGQTIG